eukprot:TRINITY_DN1255_c2_g3_i2.p1 TRINITY_DN1255_c2_g3~~TRINITY_DN1255_c2_g3_i2.p1  ORF type:complete len:642 (+),score=22.23 TRINITY_DN1255_c2_g3_i2:164-1927(+)
MSPKIDKVEPSSYSSGFEGFAEYWYLIYVFSFMVSGIPRIWISLKEDTEQYWITFNRKKRFWVFVLIGSFIQIFALYLAWGKVEKSEATLLSSTLAAEVLVAVIWYKYYRYDFGKTYKVDNFLGFLLKLNSKFDQYFVEEKPIQKQVWDEEYNKLYKIYQDEYNSTLHHCIMQPLSLAPRRLGIMALTATKLVQRLHDINGFNDTEMEEMLQLFRSVMVRQLLPGTCELLVELSIFGPDVYMDQRMWLVRGLAISILSTSEFYDYYNIKPAFYTQNQYGNTLGGTLMCALMDEDIKYLSYESRIHPKKFALLRKFLSGDLSVYWLLHLEKTMSAVNGFLCKVARYGIAQLDMLEIHKRSRRQVPSFFLEYLEKGNSWYNNKYQELNEGRFSPYNNREDKETIEAHYLESWFEFTTVAAMLAESKDQTTWSMVVITEIIFDFYYQGLQQQQEGLSSSVNTALLNLKDQHGDVIVSEYMISRLKQQSWTPPKCIDWQTKRDISTTQSWTQWLISTIQFTKAFRERLQQDAKPVSVERQILPALQKATIKHLPTETLDVLKERVGVIQTVQKVNASDYVRMNTYTIHKKQ